MAEIVHAEKERCRVYYEAGPQERALTLREARDLICQDLQIAVFVNGWEQPWLCRIDAFGELRARCPGAQADPVIVAIAEEATNALV